MFTAGNYKKQPLEAAFLEIKCLRSTEYKVIRIRNENKSTGSENLALKPAMDCETIEISNVEFWMLISLSSFKIGILTALLDACKALFRHGRRKLHECSWFCLQLAYVVFAMWYGILKINKPEKIYVHWAKAQDKACYRILAWFLFACFLLTVLIVETIDVEWLSRVIPFRLCDSRKINYLTREFHVKFHLKNRYRGTNHEQLFAWNLT